MSGFNARGISDLGDIGSGNEAEDERGRVAKIANGECGDLRQLCGKRDQDVGILVYCFFDYEIGLRSIEERITIDEFDVFAFVKNVLDSSDCVRLH